MGPSCKALKLFPPQMEGECLNMSLASQGLAWHITYFTLRISESQKLKCCTDALKVLLSTAE